jgi:hypothetical protein
VGGDDGHAPQVHRAAGQPAVAPDPDGPWPLTACPVWGVEVAGKVTAGKERVVSGWEPADAMGGKMAAIFLLLAVVDAALLGNLVLANPNAGSVSVLDRSVTGFTQGQLLLVAAGLGVLLALLVEVTWSSSSARRLKDRQLRTARREVQGRVARLERDNARLHQQLQGVQPTGQVVGSQGASSQAP